ncbi:hypothetical protein MACJ_002423 [Theileria orientalis]|uniref:TFIIS central domain-containing protein n=1 Tax=Theileria orientalis TaxID=68886 RepID=A0A976M8K0_THEOR|nr:hypothetical protein MACJ_002423 [Theileria orientalis]
MRTRGLKLEFTDDGVVSHPKYSDYSEYEKMKIRKVYGTKIKEALLKSFLELRVELSSIGSKLGRQNQDFIRKLARFSDDEVKTYVKNISDKICDSCYDEYSGNLRILKRKIFELCSNIKRESNSELREKILLRKMSILELVRADTLELAPEDVREQRKKEIEHHYIRNVILKTNVGNDDDEQPPKADEASTSDKLPMDEATRNQNTIDSLRKFFTTSDSASSSTDTSVTITGGSGTVPKIKRLKTNPNDDNPDDTTDISNTDADKTKISNIFGTTDITATVGGTNITRAGRDISISSSSSFRPSSSSDNKTLIGSSIRKTKVINENEDLERNEGGSASTLPTPPYCKDYKFEAVSSRILNRIQSLPAYMVKPFMDPYTAGSKRVQMLLQRSSILLRSVSSN